MEAIFAQRSKPKPTGRPSGASLALKREAGAIAGMPLFMKRDAAIQAKLTVNPANDAYEQEADRVADQVTSVSNSAPTVQRKCDQCDQEEQIQRKPLVNLSIQRQAAEPQGLFDVGCFRSNFAGVYETKRDLMFNRIGWRLIHPGACTDCEGQFYVDCCEHGDRECESSSAESTAVQQKSESTSGSVAQPSIAGVESTLANKQGSGSPLPDAVKGTMESRMGYDLSHVRIHTDQDSVQLNRTLGAQAFTQGENVFFAAGKFNPHSTTGTHLLAHELTHVIQQTGGIQTKRSPEQPTIQRKCAACEEEIQRSPDGFPPKLNWGDWEFKPTPQGSTEERYDTPENRRRAEMQDSDERSNDPTPNEWWKPQTPSMPKPPKGCPPARWNPLWNSCCPQGKHKDPNSPNCISDSDAAPELSLPPAPPAEKGDFPLPNPDEQYA